MKIFGKNKTKPYWSFSQEGNIWRFIFGGNKYIIGETRDTEKILKFFTLEYATGKVNLKNFNFEDSDFWVSIEGASEKAFFLGRFENPQLPYQKNIIAIDNASGEKLWENEEYSYYFNTDDRLFGLKRKFESSEIVEINITDGKVKKVLSEEEHIDLFDLRNSNEDMLYENSNYPVAYKEEETEASIKEIFEDWKEKNVIESIEYIQKGSLLIFNYYIKLESKESNPAKQIFENRFVIFDMDSKDIKFEEVLNKETNFCVPDNFFTKNEYLFYLKEKTELHCIKINDIG